jgi:hypothetical protein
MRIAILILAFAFLANEAAGLRQGVGASAPKMVPAVNFAASPRPARVDFDSQIKPILQNRCMPCHFNGGKMYDRLPFDRPETIRKLGAKLFTRIQDENHRRLINDFLTQTP